MFSVAPKDASFTREEVAHMFLGSIAKKLYNKQYGEYRNIIDKTGPFGLKVNYFRRFYEYFEEKVNEYFPVKSSNEKIFLVQSHCASFGSMKSFMGVHNFFGDRQ